MEGFTLAAAECNIMSAIDWVMGGGSVHLMLAFPAFCPHTTWPQIVPMYTNTGRTPSPPFLPPSRLAASMRLLGLQKGVKLKTNRAAWPAEGREGCSHIDPPLPPARPPAHISGGLASISLRHGALMCPPPPARTFCV